MQYSVNHHYIPIFFQKGFCNSNGLIYVYDKILDKIYPPSIPDRRFYAKNLNNLIHEGKVVSSSEESLYGPIDTKGSRVLMRILENNTLTDDTSDFEKIDMLYFMTNLVWRTPSSNELLTYLIKKEGLCNNYFGFYNEITGERYSDENENINLIKKEILNDPNIAKHLKAVIAHSDSSKIEIIKMLKTWKLFILEQTNQDEFLIGDMPIIFYNPEPSFDCIFDRAIFPLAKNKVLIINNDKPKFIDDITIRNINLSTIKSSKRYFGSGNEENLNYYIDFYKRFSKSKHYEDTIECTFGFIDYLAKFENFDHYLYNRKHHWG